MSGEPSQLFDGYAADFTPSMATTTGRLSELSIGYSDARVVRYEKSLAGCQPVAGRCVIDVGCGPGHYSIALRAPAPRNFWDWISLPAC